MRDWYNISGTIVKPTGCVCSNSASFNGDVAVNSFSAGDEIRRSVAVTDNIQTFIESHPDAEIVLYDEENTMVTAGNCSLIWHKDQEKTSVIQYSQNVSACILFQRVRGVLYCIDWKPAFLFTTWVGISFREVYFFSIINSRSDDANRQVQHPISASSGTVDYLIDDRYWRKAFIGCRSRTVSAD